MKLPLGSPDYTGVNNIGNISTDISGEYGGFYRWATFKIFTIPEIGLNKLQFKINGLSSNINPQKLYIKVNNDNVDNDTGWLNAITSYNTNNYNSTNSLDDGSGCLVTDSYSNEIETRLCVLNDNSGNYDISGDVYVRLGLDVTNPNTYKFDNITIDDSALIYDGYLDISGGTHKFLSGVPTYTTDDYVDFTARYMFNTNNLGNLGTFTSPNQGINRNIQNTTNDNDIITHRFNFDGNNSENANIKMTRTNIGSSFSPSQDLSGFHVKTENGIDTDNTDSTRKIRVDSTSVSTASIHVTSGLGLYPPISSGNITTDPSGCGITYNNDVHKISLDTSGNDGYQNNKFNFHELQFKNGKFQKPDASGYDTLIFPTGAPNYSTPNNGVNDITNISTDISGSYGGFYRWTTFKIKDNFSGTSFTFDISGLENLNKISDSSYKLYIKIHSVSNNTGWLDATLGAPANSDFTNGKGCLNMVLSNIYSRKVQLGNTAKSGAIYVRLGLKVNIENSIRFRNITINE